MSEAHTKAGQKRWKKISKKERSRRMTLIVNKKWSNMSTEERSEQGKRMALGRWGNKSNN